VGLIDPFFGKRTPN